MSSPQITVSEWQAELDKLTRTPESAGGATRREIADTLGIPYSAVINVLHAAQHAGRLVVGKEKRSALDGRIMLVPVYRIKKA